MAHDSLEPVPSLEGEREVALARIQQAFAEGHLAHADLEARLDAVLAAGSSGAMAAALVSLPDPHPGRTVTIVTMKGRIRRDGAWPVPRTLRIESEYASVSLDLSRAVLESPVVDIELQLTYGRARIIVPATAVVELDDMRTDWKQPRYSPPRSPSVGGPVIRVSGFLEYGRLTVRHRRR